MPRAIRKLWRKTWTNNASTHVEGITRQRNNAVYSAGPRDASSEGDQSPFDGEPRAPRGPVTTTRRCPPALQSSAQWPTTNPSGLFTSSETVSTSSSGNHNLLEVPPRNYATRRLIKYAKRCLLVVIGESNILLGLEESLSEVLWARRWCCSLSPDECSAKA